MLVVMSAGCPSRVWRFFQATLVIAGVLLLPAAASAAPDQDWGQAGGGPAHTGSVDGETVITRASVEGLRVVWSHRFGGLDAVSSPSVVAGRVFASVYQTEIFGAPLQVWAFDASSGAPIWHRRLAGTDWLSAPAVAGGRVFVQSSRHLLALDARTGVTLWRRDDAIAFAEPVLAGGLVYVGQNTASCCAAGLVAYRARDGRLVWRRTISGLTQMSAPAIAGGHAYAASVSANVSNSSRRAFTLWAFDAQSGRTLWARNPPLNGSEYPNGVFATPSVARRVVYDGGLDAYSATGRRIWISNQPGGGSDVTPTVGHGFVFNELAALTKTAASAPTASTTATSRGAREIPSTTHRPSPTASSSSRTAAPT